ncbi:YitT family protein [Tumebacillus flagellatus]|uniref:Membrane protein n=1 Tax=Tumebacillus flagellatus TaxID=1157490 RepID=A0A074M6K6_9BACL|nr:YitT family protein [Tumebacillus flagellatus]KEO81597.1 membrane protein [Tumebacillus flagellatus]
MKKRQRRSYNPRTLLFLDYLYITLGSLLVGLAVTWVFVPNKTVTGGVTGISILLYYLFGWKVSITSLCINIPLFWAGFRFLGGREFALKTLYGILALTLWLQFLEPLKQHPLTENTLLASIYGGLLLGAGLGIVFRGRATTGGTDLAARLVQNYTGISAGTLLLVIDGSIITAAGVIFGIERVLYALISLFITSKTIDLVQQGVAVGKVSYIITDREEEVRQAILFSLMRGCTKMQSYGGFTGVERPMLMTVVSRAEVSRLKELVRQIDPRAFVIVSDVQEVLGEGFTFAQEPTAHDERSS